MANPDTGAEKLVVELLSGAKRPAVLGAGSCLMADDAAGVTITDALIERFGCQPGRFAVYTGGTAPECFTGEIKRFAPDLLLLIDAADMGLNPGSVRAIQPNEVAGVSFSTHMLPLKVMLDYLNKEIGCRTAILGIQPVSLAVGGEMDEAVTKTVTELIQVLGDILSHL